MGNVPSLTHLAPVGSAKEDTAEKTTTTEGQSEMNQPQAEDRRALLDAPNPSVAASELDAPSCWSSCWTSCCPCWTVTDTHAMTAPDDGQQQSSQREGGPGADKAAADDVHTMPGIAGTLGTQKPPLTMSASTDFALNLLRAASDPAGNFVISPFSLGAALSIILEGAEDCTQKELTKVISKNLSPAEVTTLYASLTTALCQKSPAVMTSTANRFFLDRAFTLKEAYLSRLQKEFNAGAENINFKDGVASAKYVNGFVKKNTGGMIRTLVEKSSFGGNSVALLASAFYFKGEWETQFKKKDTVRKLFHGISGDRNEYFMIASDVRASYSIDDDDDLTVVSLSYKDPSYSLALLMPPDDFGAWRGSLTAEKLQAALRNLQSGKIHIEIPKFKIKSFTDGKAALQRCGVNSIFTDTGDLSAITDKRFYVGNIAHKSVIEVSEEGTKAAAAVTGQYIIFDCPPELIFDRPFVFVLLKDMKEVLFVGQIA